jgi:hypothetical protein
MLVSAIIYFVLYDFILRFLMIFCLFIHMGMFPLLVGLPGALSSCNPTKCLASRLPQVSGTIYEKLTTQLESFL